jgi:hypothetical protein
VPGARARRAGFVTLAAGCLIALVVYVVGISRNEPDIDDLLPNYSAANSRQMGLLYGHSGELMWEAMEAFRRPVVQALAIVVGSGLVAAVCFRIAWLDADHAAAEDEVRG